jgi:hypothetical protein
MEILLAAYRLQTVWTSETDPIVCHGLRTITIIRNAPGTDMIIARLNTPTAL